MTRAGRLALVGSLLLAACEAPLEPHAARSALDYDAGVGDEFDQGIVDAFNGYDAYDAGYDYGYSYDFSQPDYGQPDYGVPDYGCYPWMTCWNLGYQCGTFIDDCGNLQDCGGCAAPDTCGGGGWDHYCGCAPTTCEAQGASCGTLSDGCGGTLNCGGCSFPQSCSGNTCVGGSTCPEPPCTPQSCTSECGVPDGCGGILTCGCSQTVLPSLPGSTPAWTGGQLIAGTNFLVWPNQNLQYWVRDLLGVGLVYNSSTQNNLGSSGYYGWNIANAGTFYLVGSGYRLIEGDGTVRSFNADGNAVDPTDQTRVLGLDSQSHYKVGSALAWRVFDCAGREISRNTANPNLYQTFSYDSAGRLTQLSDWANRTVTLAYTNGALTSITRYDGAQVTIATTYPWNYPYVNQYAGNLTDISAPEGHYYFSYYWGTPYSLWRAETPSDLAWFLYGYFSTNQGQVVTAMDQQNHIWDFQNQPGVEAGSGQVRFTDERQHSETFAFYDSSLISDNTQPENTTTYYAWDSSHRLIQRLDSVSGHWEVFGYNSNNDIVSDVSGPPNRKSTYTYNDNSHHPSAITDVYGRTTSVTYTALGLPQTVVRHAIGGAAYDTFQFTYDSYGQYLQTTQNGRVIYSATLDSLGLPLSVAGPDGHSATYSWDTHGNPTRTVTPDGKVTSYTWANDRLSTVSDTHGRTTTVTRDANGLPSTVQFPNGVAGGGSIQYTRDNAGHVTNEIAQTGLAARAVTNTTSYGMSGAPESTSVSGSGGYATQQNAGASFSSPPFPGGDEFWPYLPGFAPSCAGRSGSQLNDLNGGLMDCPACATGEAPATFGECVESNTSGPSCGH